MLYDNVNVKHSFFKVNHTPVSAWGKANTTQLRQQTQNCLLNY